jgi:uncharacterized surface protein with fasciclin (FAS1) repeats
MKNPLLAFAAALALLLAACGDADDGAVTGAAQEAGDLADQAETELEQTDTQEVAAQLRSRGLNTLASAIETVGIENVIEGQTFTLFAPRDEAWLALDAEALGNLLGDPQRAAEVLQSHVVNERLTSDELADRTTVTAASGRTLTVADTSPGLSVDGAAVVEADIEVGDGVVHIVDQIIAAELIGVTGGQG